MTKRSPSSRGSGLFEGAPPASPARGPSYTANIDGAARGNPGPASYGVVVRDPSGLVVARLKKYIGQCTNNVAEYYGLIAALDYAQSHGIRALRIESDSELLVKQMRGEFKVKNDKDRLVPLCDVTKWKTMSTLPIINRYNHLRKVELTAGVDAG